MNWIRRIMNKLFIDNESFDIDEDDITMSQIKNRIYVNGNSVKVKGNVGGSIEANSIEVGGDVEGDITANSVKVRGKHTGSISM